MLFLCLFLRVSLTTVVQMVIQNIHLKILQKTKKKSNPGTRGERRKTNLSINTKQKTKETNNKLTNSEKIVDERKLQKVHRTVSITKVSEPFPNQQKKINALKQEDC
jgi:hypothetical protein